MRTITVTIAIPDRMAAGTEDIFFDGRELVLAANTGCMTHHTLALILKTDGADMPMDEVHRDCCAALVAQIIGGAVIHARRRPIPTSATKH